MSDFCDERRRIVYEFEQWGQMLFIPACEKCGRFVKADASMGVRLTDNGCWAGPIVEPKTPNADCKKCGRVAMVWEGFQ